MFGFGCLECHYAIGNPDPVPPGAYLPQISCLKLKPARRWRRVTGRGGEYATATNAPYRASDDTARAGASVGVCAVAAVPIARAVPSHRSNHRQYACCNALGTADVHTIGASLPRPHSRL